MRAIAAAAGIDSGHLCRIEAGDVRASLGVLVSVAAALGGDLNVRFHPGTGPSLRDRFQAPMVESLLVAAHFRWRRLVEVAVRRPVRGVIDVVLHDGVTLVAVEAQSELRNLEQQVRWNQEKAAALRSSDLFPFASAAEPPAISRVLLLRSTEATRAIARRYPETLRAAYPARSRDVYESLVGERPWPGAGIIWARVSAGHAEVMAGPPRGVALGR
jgi:hypothetical protein